MLYLQSCSLCLAFPVYRVKEVLLYPTMFTMVLDAVSLFLHNRLLMYKLLLQSAHLQTGISGTG